MISTVTTGIFASLLSLTSAGPSLRATVPCWYSNYYCSNTAGVSPVTVEGADYPAKIVACYNLCNADSSCNEFTLLSVQNGNRALCYLLTEPCERNSADQCLAEDDFPCRSGPKECADYEEGTATCAQLPSLGADYINWICTLGDKQFNPYNEVLPVGTLCTQTCPAWKTKGSNPPTQSQLESTCVDNAGTAEWGPTVTKDEQEIEGLTAPYPKPDATTDAYSCGCLPLELQLKWPYDPTGANDANNFYDPNTEEAADFICKQDLETNPGDADWTIKGDNSCNLYCDQHYVATAACVDGEWTGNPEWGFWCYEAPA